MSDVRPATVSTSERVLGLKGSARSRRVWLGIFLGFVAIGTGSLAIWLVTTFDPFGHARAAYGRKEYRSALAAARGHLDRFPASTTAALMAARCLTRLGRLAEAETFYGRAGRLAGDDLHDRALALLQSNQPRAAAQVYEQLLEQSPGDLLALKRLAAIHMGVKQWRSVLDVAERLAATGAEEVSARTMMGIAQHELKHYQQAVSADFRVLELDPKLSAMPLPRSLFWTNLAMDLMALGRDDEAREYLTRALDQSHDAVLMELLGLTYSRQGALDDAERCWKQAETLDPNNADLCLDLGRLYLSRKRVKEAIGYLERAAVSSADAVEPLYNLSQAYRMLGNIPESERYRQLADRKRKANPKPSGGMGADSGGSDESPSARSAGSTP
jgi:tetratricopeptide (TPR) repeat protein